jgi:hypothetical protein
MPAAASHRENGGAFGGRRTAVADVASETLARASVRARTLPGTAVRRRSCSSKARISAGHLQRDAIIRPSLP